MSSSIKQSVMYSQLQTWSQAGAPPCMEQISGPMVPTRIGICYKTPRPHPWRPILGYERIEVTPLNDQPVTNQFVNPCFTPNGMSTEPLHFPNLVTGFHRNPQHAARAALYTRYTIDEWSNACLSSYSESDKNRNYSEQLRNNIVNILRKTDDKTFEGQRDTGRCIGERITDVTFWKNELNNELERLVIEGELLSNMKRNIQKAEQDLEAPLHIGQECLYHRETRKGVEKIHDIVEKSLLLEINNLKLSQGKLKELNKSISQQLSNCRAAQYTLEEDIAHKESAIGIDSVCHQLNNFSRGINYYGGIENYDTAISTSDSWSRASGDRVTKSQSEREKCTQIRTDTEALINRVATSVWDCWSNTNNSLNKRASEMNEAKSKIQLHLQNIQNEIFTIERHIELLRKAIQDKSSPLKVAHTRLEARNHRSGFEQCKDYAQIKLMNEVKDIQESICILHDRLQKAEAQQQQLMKTRSNLETNLKNKVDALFIDREKCMGLRRSFPINNLIKY